LKDKFIYRFGIEFLIELFPSGNHASFIIAIIKNKETIFIYSLGL